MVNFLVPMTRLPDEKLKEVKPDMPVRQIKAISIADKPKKAVKTRDTENLPIDVKSAEIERNVILKFKSENFSGMSEQEQTKIINDVLLDSINTIKKLISFGHEVILYDELKR